MKTRITLILLCFLLTVFSDLHAGGFSRLPVSARAVSLGGSLVTCNDDPNVLFYNPAGIAALSSLSLSTSYSQLFPGITDDNLRLISASAAANLGFVGTIGVGVKSFSATTWKEQEFIGSYAQEFFEGFSVGGNVKFLHWSTPDIIGQTNFDEPGMSKNILSFDVGIQSQLRDIFPDNDLRLGLMFGDITRPSIAVNNSDSARLDFKIAAGAEYSSRVYDYNVVVHYTSMGEVKHWGIGAEINILKTTVGGSPAELVVRFGGSGLARFKLFEEGTLKLKFNTGDESISGGFGLLFSGLRVDYAYGSPMELAYVGGTHHLSLRYTY